MKCQNCGNHEANFHYRSNINGRITEQHLCNDCAQTLEGSMFAGLSTPMQAYEGFFSQPLSSGSLFGDSFFTDSMRWMDQMSRSFFTPVLRDTMAPEREMPVEPQVEAAPTAPVEPAEGHIPTDAGNELKLRRQLNQMRREMKAAVKAEDFERAAQLRDEIYRLEQNKG